MSESKPWEDFASISPVTTETKDRKPWEDFGGQPEKPPSLIGEAGRGLVRGVAGIPQTVYGLAGLVGNKLNMPSVQKWGEESAESLRQRLEPYAPSIPSISDVQSPSDFAHYAVGGLASFIPELMLLKGAGAIGAKAGKAITGAEKAIEAATTAPSISPRVAGIIAKQAPILQAGEKWGGRAGIAALMGTQSLGNIAETQKATQQEYNLPMALTGAGASAAFGVLPFSRLAEKTGLINRAEKGTLEYAKKLAESGYFKAAGKEALVEGASMAPAMVGMNVAERFGAGQELTSPEAVKAYLDAAAGGALIGGVAGGVGGAINRGKMGYDLVAKKELNESSQAKSTNKIVELAKEEDNLLKTVVPEKTTQVKSEAEQAKDINDTLKPGEQDVFDQLGQPQPSMDVELTKHYEDEAKRLGLRFDGVQKWNELEMPQFTWMSPDPKKRTSFLVGPDQTIDQAFEETRIRFEPKPSVDVGIPSRLQIIRDNIERKKEERGKLVPQKGEPYYKRSEIEKREGVPSDIGYNEEMGDLMKTEGTGPAGEQQLKLGVGTGGEVGSLAKLPKEQLKPVKEREPIGTVTSENGMNLFIIPKGVEPTIVKSEKKAPIDYVKDREPISFLDLRFAHEAPQEEMGPSQPFKGKLEPISMRKKPQDITITPEDRVKVVGDTKKIFGNEKGRDVATNPAIVSEVVDELGQNNFKMNVGSDNPTMLNKTRTLYEALQAISERRQAKISDRERESILSKEGISPEDWDKYEIFDEQLKNVQDAWGEKGIKEENISPYNLNKQYGYSLTYGDGYGLIVTKGKNGSFDLRVERPGSNIRTVEDQARGFIEDYNKLTDEEQASPMGQAMYNKIQELTKEKPIEQKPKPVNIPIVKRSWGNRDRLAIDEVWGGRGGQKGNKNIENTKPGESGWLGNPYATVEEYRKVFDEKINTDESFRNAVLSIAEKGQKLASFEGGNGRDAHLQVITDWLRDNYVPGGEKKTKPTVAKNAQVESKPVSVENAPTKTMVTKIISGGQSGADVSGLEIAKELGLETGGTAAAKYAAFDNEGKRTNTPEYKEKYGLKEGKWYQNPRTGGFDPYHDRTIKNAQEADGTVWFGKSNSPGGRLTLGNEAQNGKPKPLINPTPDELKQWIIDNDIKTLNVAGNREHTNVGISETTKNVLREALGGEQVKPKEEVKPIQKSIVVDGMKWQYDDRFVIDSTGKRKDAGWYDENGMPAPTSMTQKLNLRASDKFGSSKPTKSLDDILFEGTKIKTDKLDIELPKDFANPDSEITINSISSTEPIRSKLNETFTSFMAERKSDVPLDKRTTDENDPNRNILNLENAAKKIAVTVASEHNLPFNETLERVRGEMGLNPKGPDLMADSFDRGLKQEDEKVIRQSLDTKADLEKVYPKSRIAQWNDEALPRLSKWVSEKHPDLKEPTTFTLVSGKSNELSSVASRIGKLFGIDVAFIKTDKGTYMDSSGKEVKINMHGLYDGESKTIFINTSSPYYNSDKALIHTVGHEISHSLKELFPKQYGAIHDFVMKNNKSKSQPFFEEFKKYFENSSLNKTYDTIEKLQNEFVNDIIGRHFLEPKFWDSMLITEPTLWGRVTGSVKTLIDKVLSATSPIIESKYIGRLKFTGDLYTKLVASRNTIEKNLLEVRKLIKAQEDIDSFNAKSAEVRVPEGNDLKDVLDALPKVTSPGDNAKKRFNAAEEWAKKKEGLQTQAHSLWEQAKAAGAVLFHNWKNPPVSSKYKDYFGDYMVSRAVTSFHNMRFAKEMVKTFPSKIRREAIVNYIQAGGDMNLLKERESMSSERFKEGYKVAQELNETEKQWADVAKNYFQVKLQKSINMGMLKNGIENYVNQLYEYDKSTGVHDALRKLMAEVDSGAYKKALETDPYFLQKRIYQTYFEAEQKGKTPKNKDIGFLMNSYDRAFNEAVAARTFMKTMFNNGTADDGRPYLAFSSGGTELPFKDMDKNMDRILVDREDSRGRKDFYTGDYKEVPHPALRSFMHVVTTPDGRPALYESQLLIHPDVYKTKFGDPDMKSFLTKSKIMEVPVLRGIMKVSSEIKSTLLSLSAFHQVQVGLHAVFHKVDPTGKFQALKEIDMTDPAQIELVRRGLMISDYNGSSLFMEGLQASGLINKLPVIGQYLQQYNHYLFTEYIPKLKVNMALGALERNRKVYGKSMTDAQIHEITARQANAAFGELNYYMLGRSRTMQDISRLGLLAPDFLEARGRFVAQALTPKGKEQAAALLRSALMLYTGGLIMNAVINGETHWDKPMKVLVGDNEYMLRSVVGDMLHAWSDPRGFVYNRLNPVTTRTSIEWLTGRDKFGRKKDLAAQAKEFVYTNSPIPTQGAVQKLLGEESSKGRGILDAAVNSFGASSLRHRSKADKLIAENMPRVEDPNENKEVKRLHRKFVEQYRETKTVIPELHEAQQKRMIDQRQIQIWMREARVPEQVSLIKHINDPKALAKIWDSMTDEEKNQLGMRTAYNLKKSHLRMRTPIE